MSKKKNDTDKLQFPIAANGSTTNWRILEWLLASPDVLSVYLHGPPGLGKTYAALHFGRITKGVFCITLTEDTPAAELRGHFMPKNRDTVWHDGPFTMAMRSGARLVLNEVTHAPAEVLSLLLPVLESPDTAVLTLPNNETVRPAAGFHVVATDNAAPDELPAALRDRFHCVFEIREPHPNAVAALREPYRTAAVRAFALEDERRISLRGWMTLQNLVKELELEDACAAIFGRERGAQIHDALALLASQLKENGGGAP